MNRAWAAISSPSVRRVSRKAVTPGGVARSAVRAVASSITPGPEGMSPTSPTASAPATAAVRASPGEVMQQIFTRVRMSATSGSVAGWAIR